jgi:acetyltransferase
MVNLRDFFYPRTIAIIGASSHVDKVGGILMEKAIFSNLKIIPVNPKHDKISGIKCFKSILDYPGKIDLAVIAVPKEFVLSTIEECVQKEVRDIVIISAGFSEVGNSEDENKLLALASNHGVRFVGPNCFGVFNSKNNLDLTFSKEISKLGDIAFISQSGALWSYLSDLSVGFSKFIGLGNMADLEFSDFISYLSNDSETKNIILYIEKIKKGKEFIEACKIAVKKGKKIFAVKAGRSKEGEKATFSHTASLASDYEIYRGVFKQSGVEVCETVEEAIEKASGQHIIIKTKPLKLENVDIITNAGGAGALVLDYLSEKGIKINSSKDILGTALAEDYTKAFEDIQAKEVIVILTPQSMSEITKTAQTIVDYSRSSGKKIIALFLGKESVKGQHILFEKNNISYFNDLRSFKDSL